MALAYLTKLKAGQRPQTVARLCNQLARKRCHSIRSDRLVKPIALAKSLIKRLDVAAADRELQQSLEELLGAFKEQTEDNANAVDADAVVRTLVRLRSLRSTNFVGQALKDRAAWLCCQSFGLVLTTPQDLVEELVSQGIVSTSDDGHVSYNEALLGKEVVLPANQPWDPQLLFTEAGMSTTKKEPSKVIVNDLKLSGGFFGRNGGQIMRLREALQSCGLKFTITNQEKGTITISSASLKCPKVDILSEAASVVKMIANKAPLFTCEQDLGKWRAGNVIGRHGRQVERLQADHDVQLSLKESKLYGWPLASMLELPFRVGSAEKLRQKAFAAKAEVERSIERILASAVSSRSAKLTETTPPHKMPMLDRTFSAQHEISKFDRANGRGQNRRKDAHHKENVARKAEKVEQAHQYERHGHGQRVHGGRHKSGEDPADD